MAEENLHIPNENIDYHLVTIFEKLESLRSNSLTNLCKNKVPIQVELRTLEFWRSVTSELLATFVYVFIVCGAAAGAGVGSSISSVILATALSSGFTICTLTQCFGHISGAHVNPSVSIAMGITQRISMLRTFMFILAQYGGGIAAAAFIYSVTAAPGYPGNLSSLLAYAASIPPWERFAIEFILTFIVVFTYFISMDTYRKFIGTSALTIGSTYAACSFVSMPFLNPARSLGLAFVLNSWENHWVYFMGPMLGGLISGLIYEYIFNAHRLKRAKESTDGDSSSIPSDEDNYDDLDKPAPSKFHGSTYNMYRSAGGPNGPTYCHSLTTSNLYSTPANKLERVESLYCGTKSLGCRSPPLTRANLNRSQSVCTKSNSGGYRDSAAPKPGPLVPAQSLYPMRLNQQTHLQNQNVQNQMQQRTDPTYGVRGVTPGTTGRTENYQSIERGGYPTRNPSTVDQNSTNKYDEHTKNCRANRPESMYGILGMQTRRIQSNQSDDSSTYSSYSRTYQPKGAGRNLSGNEGKINQPNPLLNNPSSYTHQHSPNSQY